MIQNLRVAAMFNNAVAEKFAVPGLERAVVIDDHANLLHEVDIEYDILDDQLYRRLNYKMTAMQNMNEVGRWTNDMAQQLLLRLANSLAGSTLSDGRTFQKGMFILSADEVWDDELPSDPDTNVDNEESTDE